MREAELKVGLIVGRLTLVSQAGEDARGRRWNCRCECGREVTTWGQRLATAKTRSCGCLRRDVTRARVKKHYDLTGQTFGEWTVLGEAERGNTHKRRWVCRCSCGYESVVFQDGLLYGNSRSCGRGGHKPRPTTTPGYSSWYAMKDRCTNTSHVYYKQYGGRGITVCERWLESFWNFYDDMGPRPEGMSLDRIDPNGNYEPSNCRWATASEQMSNRRGSCLIRMGAETVTVKDLAAALGLSYATVHSRLSKAGLL